MAVSWQLRILKTLITEYQISYKLIETTVRSLFKNKSI